VAKLDNCLADIRDWMAADFLQIIDDKIWLIFGNPKRLVPIHDFELSVGKYLSEPVTVC